jgi:hypothetical protein
LVWKEGNDHLSNKQAAYAGDALPQRVKAFIAIGVGIALDSPAYILNYVKAEKEAGASEAFLSKSLFS